MCQVKIHWVLLNYIVFCNVLKEWKPAEIWKAYTLLSTVNSSCSCTNAHWRKRWKDDLWNGQKKYQKNLHSHFTLHVIYHKKKKKNLLFITWKFFIKHHSGKVVCIYFYQKKKISFHIYYFSHFILQIG